MIKKVDCTYDSEVNAFYICLTKKHMKYGSRRGYLTEHLPSPLLFLRDKDDRGKTVGIEIVSGETKI